MLVGVREHLAEHFRVPTELELRGESLLDRGEPELLEPLALARARSPRTRARRTRGRATARARWLGERQRRAPRCPLARASPHSRSSRSKRVGVERVRLELERVAAAAGHDLDPRGERLAQLRDVDLDELSGRRGRRPSHTASTSSSTAARCSSADDERGQQPRLLRGERTRPGVADDLERAENTHRRPRIARILAGRGGAWEDPGYTEAKARSSSFHAMSYAFVEDVAASWESYEHFAAGLERSLPRGLDPPCRGTDGRGRSHHRGLGERGRVAPLRRGDRASADNVLRAPRVTSVIQPYAPRLRSGPVVKSATKEESCTIDLSRRVLAAFAVVGTALAAAPTKGGVYQGELFATSTAAIKKKVRLVVTKTGTSARVIWWCGEGRAPSTLRVQIAADGSFKGTSNVGTLTVWAIKGRFVSPAKAPLPFSSRRSAMPRAAPSPSCCRWLRDHEGRR